MEKPAQILQITDIIWRPGDTAKNLEITDIIWRPGDTVQRLETPRLSGRVDSPDSMSQVKKLYTLASSAGFSPWLCWKNRSNKNAYYFPKENHFIVLLLQYGRRENPSRAQVICTYKSNDGFVNFESLDKLKKN